MLTSTSLRWLVVAVSAAILLAVAAACGDETVEVPGETVVVEKEVIKEVQVPGETVVVEKEVVKTVEVPGETVVKEVVREVEVPGETVVVEKEVVKTVEVPGQTVVVEKEVVKEVEAERYARNVWGELVEKPQYGGSLPHATFLDDAGYPPFDPYHGWFWNWSPLVFEHLGQPDWSLPRDEFNLETEFYPVEVLTGGLAERWDVSLDGVTYTFNIRQGVNWQDKAPLNGREFTAYDAEYHLHRMLGLGSGFTERGANVGWTTEFESITATDKYTLVVKTPSFGRTVLLELLMGDMSVPNMIGPAREVVEQYGDGLDWRNVVGTGPYMVTDYIEASSLTLTKNPDYWQYDPRFPGLDFRLPYVDEIKLFFMPDEALRIAALRTGKHGFENFLPPPQVKGIRRTNPEIVILPVSGTAFTGIQYVVDRPPFDDKNVRIAMQKAINYQEIVNVFYERDADPTPWGFAGDVTPGAYAPYAEWPEEVKWQYEYDPAEAGRLLDEAGYTIGADGTRGMGAVWNFYTAWGDVDLAQLVVSYWAEIGADVELFLAPDRTAILQRLAAGEHGGMVGCWACRKTPSDTVRYIGSMFHTKGAGNNRSSLPGTGASGEFDAIFDQIAVTKDPETANALVRELDEIFIEELWAPAFPVVPRYVLHQPWLKGYGGEKGGADVFWMVAGALVWIDQELKEGMGH